MVRTLQMPAGHLALLASQAVGRSRLLPLAANLAGLVLHDLSFQERSGDCLQQLKSALQQVWSFPEDAKSHAQNLERYLSTM